MVAPCFIIKLHPAWCLGTEPSVYTVKLCDLLIIVFVFWITRSLFPCVPRQRAILSSIFANFLTGGSHKAAGIAVWIRVSLLFFSRLGYLWCEPLCLTHSRFASFKSATFRVCASFLQWVVGVFCCTDNGIFWLSSRTIGRLLWLRAVDHLQLTAEIKVLVVARFYRRWLRFLLVPSILWEGNRGESEKHIAKRELGYETGLWFFPIIVIRAKSLIGIMITRTI